MSLLASKFFTDPVNGLNVTTFLTFLAGLTGFVHLVGACLLRTPPEDLDATDALHTERLTIAQDDIEHSADADEQSPLIPGKAPQASVEVIPVHEDRAVTHLLKDPFFWTLALIILIIPGTVSNSSGIKESPDCVLV